MESRAFDTLTRSLSGAPSRRVLARAFAGSVLGGLLSVVGHEEADARKCGPCLVKKRGRCTKDRRDDRPCRGDGRCLNGRCNPKQTCKGFLDPCLLGIECCSGVCRADQKCDSSYPQRGHDVCSVKKDCATVCYADGSCDMPCDCVGYRCGSCIA